MKELARTHTLLLFAALISTALFGLAQPAPRKAGIPESVTPLTREQLNTVVPHFYCIEYPFDPQPGKRYWLRVTDRRWIERYPNGEESVFRVLGHGNVKDYSGTILVKVKGDTKATATDNSGGLQAFIPDKGSAQMHHWYRNSGRGDSDWHDLGQMISVE